MRIILLSLMVLAGCSSIRNVVVVEEAPISCESKVAEIYEYLPFSDEAVEIMQKKASSIDGNTLYISNRGRALLEEVLHSPIDYWIIEEPITGEVYKCNREP
ncbi:hypothetical protein [Aurantivibrio infirmus]